MPLDQLDVIIRIAGATLLVVAAIGKWRRGDRSDDRWFAPLALCLCGFLAGNTPVSALQLGGPIGHLAVLLSGLTVAFLWWFCLSVFDWTFRPRGAVLIVGLMWMVVACADRGVFGEAIAQRGLSWVLIAMGLGMMAYLAWRLVRDREGDLIDSRRRSRLWVAILPAAQLLADMGADLAFGLDWQPQLFSIAQNAAVLAFTGWLLALGGDRVAASPAVVRAPTASDPEATALEARLRRLMEVDKVWLDPHLDLAAFVRMMSASERAVRRLILDRLGHDHFRTFLNAARMAEARRLLADPARRDEKLIVIAMDSGFASLPSFNRVFQQVEGASPGAWRSARLSTSDAEAGRTAPAA
ncbi:helix-turn-helix transcriptional regulator [Brevundimonas goettingensis]|uniref:Helix-turn-helix transcriptional regulator n=1 Tax=Brevundimonas goettingensis TaxID=2774190 RepID=A0A975C419_9CAUL|nr:helix-turn-helix transcriptional regulator [Brevundimonas goettingensis]QTC92074.1 helix-turn-helix transcriptional regulator [Brevundimonas goettingensis]